MPSLKDIRRRISSVKNTQQITRAMKMVAAAKLRRAQEACEEARPYADRLDHVVTEVVRRMEGASHPLLVERENESLDLIVIASDRGLCGGYNGNVLRAADEVIRVSIRDGKKVSLLPVGKRAVEHYRRQDRVPVVDTYVGIASSLSYGTAELIAETLTKRFLEKTSDGAKVVYNEFRSALSQVVSVRGILPLHPEGAEDQIYGVEHKFEPSREKLLDVLLPQQVAIQLFRALLEATASEHGARMTAMEAASSNAEDMIDRLTLQMNRARQAIITTELMEIVSGKESLEQ